MASLMFSSAELQALLAEAGSVVRQLIVALPVTPPSPTLTSR